MADSADTWQADINFNNVYSRGKRLVSKWKGMFTGNRCLLSLSEMMEIYPPDGESYAGTMDIRVNKIIGTEDRSEDFAENFLPTKAWMNKRWSKIWTLLKNGEIQEPLEAFEYGGLYFIRDGNHRVSAAKNQKIEFLTAKVTKLNVPFVLADDFNRNHLIHFRKKAEFQKKTGFYDHVKTPAFDIRRLKSWNILEKEINLWHPGWYERHKADVQLHPRSELHKLWYEELYTYFIKFIDRSALHYLYPGWGDTDVAMELLRIWNNYPNPDDISVEEIYDIFLKKTKRQRFILMPVYFIFDKINYLSRTECDERWLFLERSNIKSLRPGFRLPGDLGKKYWRNLYYDLFHRHAQKLKKQLGRTPYRNELVMDWYDNVWLPRTES